MRLLAILLLFSGAIHVASAQQDPVDALTEKYEKLERDGLVGLYKRYRVELVKLRDAAMEKKNLTVANKADSKIKELTTEILKLDPDVRFPDKPKIAYPFSDFYRMTFHSGGLQTEEGHEIVCRFAKLPQGKFEDGTLMLTISADGAPNSNTPSDILVQAGPDRKLVGKIKGIGTGKTKIIPLALTAADQIELAIVVRSGDALVLDAFAKSTAPNIVLTIKM